MRDVKKDYRDAMVAEYASLVRAGRAEEAEHVAESLREQFDYDVAPAKARRAKTDKEAPDQPAETTAAAPPPETTAEPKAAAPRAPRVQSAKRTAQGDSGK